MLKRQMQTRRFVIGIIIIFLLQIGCVGGTPHNKTVDEDAAKEVSIKRTAVAGTFYCNESDELGERLDAFLNEADVEPAEQDGIFAIFTPHAGYDYSGAIAAYSYKLASKQKPETIIILSPSHSESFEGIAYSSFDEYETPIGNLQINSSFTEEMSNLCEVMELRDSAFDKEHGIETQLPFIKYLWSDCKIVPLVFGSPKKELAEKFAEVLVAVAKSDDVLIVATCDLSHFYDYETARELDSNFFELFATGDATAVFDAVDSGDCEIDAPAVIGSVLLAGETNGSKQPEILIGRNSGDVTGEKDRVVGYWAAAIKR